MQGRKVLVVCNLKAAKIVGFNSNGMVLAAKVRIDLNIRDLLVMSFDHYLPIADYFFLLLCNRVTMANRSNLSRHLPMLRSESACILMG
jgi:hypothetical protein